MNDPILEAPSRAWAVVPVRRRVFDGERHTWGTLRFRVREPDPIQCARACTVWGKACNATLMAIVNGTQEWPRVPECPRCGTKNKARQIGDGMLLCEAQHEGRPCREVFPVQYVEDDHGNPRHVSMAVVLGIDGMRRVFANSLGAQIDALTPDAMETVILETFAGALDVEVGDIDKGQGRWVTLGSRDEIARWVPNGRALKTLLIKAAQLWVLPMLGDEPEGTSPDTEAKPTPGANPPATLQRTGQGPPPTAPAR
jgi:hypothetical protein